jgi:glycosyltransferase involved in cell wall biosynthesis
LNLSACKHHIARRDGNPVDLLLFAAVPEVSMLEQGFYAAEADGLRRNPCVRSVCATNELADVRAAKVDGIVTYFYSHSAAVGSIAKARRIPAVATGGCEQLIRGEDTPTCTFAARVAAFHACTLVMRRLLATSTTDFERMREVAWFNRNRIERSFHGVAAVENASPGHFKHPRPPASLITIAGLDTELNVRRKGVLEAVDLLARFHVQDPSASLTIIGRTTCRDMVVAHARTRGIVDLVRFTGYVTEEQKLDLLHGARFYVQLSDYEGFGIGALEALAHGCEVIHTNVGGLRDTIGDYGLIVPRGAVERFDPSTIPDYAPPDWARFSAHLAQFDVTRRADTIMHALGLA